MPTSARAIMVMIGDSLFVKPEDGLAVLLDSKTLEPVAKEQQAPKGMEISGIVCDTGRYLVQIDMGGNEDVLATVLDPRQGGLPTIGKPVRLEGLKLDNKKLKQCTCYANGSHLVIDDRNTSHVFNLRTGVLLASSRNAHKIFDACYDWTSNTVWAIEYDDENKSALKYKVQQVVNPGLRLPMEGDWPTAIPAQLLSSSPSIRIAGLNAGVSSADANGKLQAALMLSHLDRCGLYLCRRASVCMLVYAVLCVCVRVEH